MSIAPTSATTVNPAPPGGMFGAAGGDFTMFLRLLTTQMQNQDPLDPMDTSRYTQQLVQYSQVEQSIQQTGLLRDMLGRPSANDMTEAAALIGREAEFDSVMAGHGGGRGGKLELVAPAQRRDAHRRGGRFVRAHRGDGDPRPGGHERPL